MSVAGRALVSAAGRRRPSVGARRRASVPGPRRLTAGRVPGVARSPGRCARAVTAAGTAYRNGRRDHGARPTVPAEPPKLANSTRRLRLGTVLALSLFVMIGVRLVVLQVAASPADAARLIKLRENRITKVVLPAAAGQHPGPRRRRAGAQRRGAVHRRRPGAGPETRRRSRRHSSPLLGVPVVRADPADDRAHRGPAAGSRSSSSSPTAWTSAIGDKIAAMKLNGIVVAPGRAARRAGRRPGGQPDRLHRRGQLRAGGARGPLRLAAARHQRRAESTRSATATWTSRSPAATTRDVEPQPGTSLELTIDSDLQFEVQRILGDQAEKVQRDDRPAPW